MNRRLGPVLVIALAGLLAACGPAVGGLGPIDTPSGSPGPSLGQASPDVTPGGSSPSPSAQPPSPSAQPPTQAPSEAPSSTGGPGPTTGPTPRPTPTPPATGTTIVRAYFHLGGEVRVEGLVPVLREVPKTQAVARAALEALLDGPTAGERNAGIASAVPDGSRLLGVSIADGVATVDLSGEFESGGGSTAAMIRLGQVTYTLTQFPTVERVLFRIDGQAVTVFGAEGIVLDGPVARADYHDLLPAVWVDRPAWGAALGNPGRVSGLANVFEAQFQVALLDAGGRIIVDEPVMATCGTGCWGSWDVTLDYDVAEAQWGTLRVYSLSAQDGSPESVRDYPVWLSRAS